MGRRRKCYGHVHPQVHDGAADRDVLGNGAIVRKKLGIWSEEHRELQDQLAEVTKERDSIKMDAIANEQVRQLGLLTSRKHTAVGGFGMHTPFAADLTPVRHSGRHRRHLRLRRLL
jgi:hypothetical protein